MPVLSGDPYFLACDEMMGRATGTPETMEGERDYSRQYLVQVNPNNPASQYLAPNMITRCPGLPLIDSVYVTPTEYDLLALCRKKSAKPYKEDDWKQWVVTADYSTKIGTRQSGAHKDQPELERPTVDWDFEELKLSPMRDLGNKAFLNSAKMPFHPAPTFNVGYPVLLMTRKELTFNVEKAQFYGHALNSDTFLGYPPGTVQCAPPKAKQMWRGNYRFWQVSYKLRFAPVIMNPEFDPDLPPGPGNSKFVYYPWQPRLLDQGMYHLDDDRASETFGKPVPIWKHGAALHHAVLLDGFGQEALGDPPKPWFIDYEVYLSASFVDLLVIGMSD